MSLCVLFTNILLKSKKVQGFKCFNDSKAFIEYSNYMDDFFKNIEEYNPNKKCKVLIVFDDMNADMLSNKELNPIVTELFIRCKKNKHFFCFNYTIFFDCTKKY